MAKRARIRCINKTDRMKPHERIIYVGVPLFIVVPAPILLGVRKAQDQCALRHSARKRPLKASMKALSVGLLGREKSNATPR
ncbi:hypothetical protein ACVJGD_008077 [Bradyrhizobium sp. USDA 10063]